MSFIALVTDSTASLSTDYVKQHNIRVVPLSINIEGTNYRDGIDIQSEAFYELLPHASTLPTTSQPSVGDFEQAYRDLIEEGATGIISIHLSSGISGTVNSALQAAKRVSVPVAVIDTQNAVAAQLVIVEAGVAAVEAAEGTGADFDSVVAAVQKAVDAQKTIFTVDSLEYLYKGGRIGGASALLGSLLQIKPMLYFKDGRIDVLERTRKSSRAMTRMVDLMVDWLGSEEPVRAVIMQAANMSAAEELAELVRKRMNVADLQIILLSPVIGAHVGNGTLGLCCCPMAACRPSAAK